MAARKPSNVLELTGAYKKNPARKRDEPRSGLPLGPPPDYLSESEVQVWNEILGHLALGVVESSDQIAFESLVRLTWKMRSDFENFSGSNMTAMLQFLVRFGMTPADRSRVTVPAGDGKEDPAKEFFG